MKSVREEQKRERGRREIKMGRDRKRQIAGREREEERRMWRERGRTSSKASSGAQEVPQEEQKMVIWKGVSGLYWCEGHAHTRSGNRLTVRQSRRWPWLGAQRRCHWSHWGQGRMPVGCHERKVDVDLAGHQRRYGGGLGFSRAQHSMTAFFPVAMELEMRWTKRAWRDRAKLHQATDGNNTAVNNSITEKSHGVLSHIREFWRAKEARARSRELCVDGKKALGMVYSGGRELSHFSTVHVGKSVCALNWKAHFAIFVGMCWVLWAECQYPLKPRCWNAHPWCDGVVGDEVMRVKALTGIDAPIKGTSQGSWSSVSCDPQWDDGTRTERADVQEGYGKRPHQTAMQGSDLRVPLWTDVPPQ